MRFQEFQQVLQAFPVFSLDDIRLVAPDLPSLTLSRWQQKGYLQKITRGYYRFTNEQRDERFLFYAANKIYSPSYISLQMALSYRGLIPEQTFGITSVTSRKTQTLNTPIGAFLYRTIKPSLFFGYALLTWREHSIRIAEVEKALLDLLYLTPSLNTPEAIEALRLNVTDLKEHFDEQRFDRYLEAFDNHALTSRAFLLKQHLHADH